MLHKSESVANLYTLTDFLPVHIDDGKSTRLGGKNAT
jgi:hypothetical protein